MKQAQQSRTFHRLLGMGIAVIMLLTAGYMKAQTLNEEFTVDNITYKVNKVSPARVTIIGNTLTASTALNIATVNHNGIIFTVDSIGQYAFKECNYLTSVTFPEVTTIGFQAFNTCSNLSRATFPKATDIGNGSFQGSSLSIASFPLAVTIQNGAFIGTNLTNASFPKAEYIGYESFHYCKNLKTAAFPNLKTITDEAFYNCFSLSSLYLGSNVPTVGTRLVFEQVPKPRYLYIIDEEGNAATATAYGSSWHDWTVQSTLPAHSAIVNITGVPETIVRTAASTSIKLNTSVGILPSTYKRNQISWTIVDAGTTGATVSMPASGDTTLTVTAPGILVLKATVTASDPDYVQTFPIQVKGHILGDVFTVDNIRYQVTSIAAGDSTVAIIGNTLSYAELKDLNISTVTDWGETFTVNSIGYSAFNHCIALNSVIFPKVTDIGLYGFSRCLNLKSISFPEAISIGGNAFAECRVLTNAPFPKAISIGSAAFIDCDELSDATFPKVSSLGEHAFQNCINLKSAAIPNVNAIRNMSFNSCNNLTTLSLGAIAPPVEGQDTFEGCPSPRSLTLVAANGTPLTGAMLNAAIVNYMNDAGYDTATGLWHGWTLPEFDRDIAYATISLENGSFQANGSQIKPSVTASFYGMPLNEGTDFTLTYTNNVEPGKATVTITGIGSYSGSQTLTFIIYAKPVYVIIPKVDGVSVTPGFGLNLAGIGQPFEFSVTPDATLGKEGTDYTIEVRNDKGETLAPNGYSYKIAAVDHETTIYIIVTRLHTTGVESISTLTIYGGQGNITVESPTDTTALVVNLTGKVIASTKLSSGKTLFNGLSQGIYIVKVGTTTQKVSVK